MKCSDCGQKYSAKGREDPHAYVFCNSCWEVRSLRDSVESIAEAIIPEETFTACGAAYWDTFKSRAGSMMALLTLGLLFGGDKEHRFGIIGITQKEIFIIDMGDIVGEMLTLDDLRGSFLKPKIKRAPLKSISITTETPAPLLRVTGDISLKAMLPEVKLGNAEKRFAIENASKQSAH